MNYFRKILKYAFPYKVYAFLNIISNSLYAIFSVLSFLALIPMLNVLFDKKNITRVKPEWENISHAKAYFENSMNYFITKLSDIRGEQMALLYMIGAVIIIFLLKNLFGYLAKYFLAYLRNGVLKDIRNEMYHKSLELPLSYYSEKRKGDIMARLSSDVLELQYSFLTILELLVREPLTIIFTLLGMFLINTQLSIFILLFIPVSGVVISYVGKKLRQHSQQAQQEQGYFLSLIEETLGGLRIIKAFTAENFFTKKFQASTKRFYHINNRLLHRQNLAVPISEFLGILVIGVILWYGGRMVLVKHTLEASAFISFMGLAYNILSPAKAMSNASFSIRKGNAAAERVLAVLESETNLPEARDAITKDNFNKEIEFKNISFKYEDDLVLKDVSLSIPKGQTVALVGQSGSGKSTMAALLSRFYDVNDGSICIDGVDIRKIKKQSLRSLMGLVSQDPILFHDSIKNNIIFGQENVSDEEVIEAAKIANAHEFILNLPHAYETNIGDAGSKLSGGQKQRLSIARAVLKNPPIMILDEATSALDTESERTVQNALDNMMKSRTSLVIAHRLSTIQKADRIVVMKEGKIIEEGTHQELIAKKGTYKMLVEMQEL